MAQATSLQDRWRGRTQQVSQLLRLLSIPGSNSVDIFVHGAPKSGKTSIVRSCLTHLGRQHAYCEVGDTTKPKQLVSSILSQLHAAKRKRASGYAGSTADNAADFVNELARACSTTRSTAYVVLDGAHLLARSPLLAALLSARELAGANVAWILVSSIPWSSQWFCEGLQPLVMAQVYFPAYTEEEVCAILTAHDLVPGFVTAVVCTHFRPITCCVPDLRAVAAYLWPHYVEPLVNANGGYGMQSDLDLSQWTRKLFAHLKSSWLPPTLEAMEPGMSHVSLIDMAVKRQTEGTGRRLQSSTTDHTLTTQYAQEWGALPLAAKLLLVAAFIASRNKATHDKSVFDVKTRQGRVRGSKKAMESDRLAEAAKEARLKGPSPFSLQRLLHIYHFIYMAADHTHARTHGALRAEDLHVLKPSFVINAPTLTHMNKADKALGLGAMLASRGGVDTDTCLGGGVSGARQQVVGIGGQHGEQGGGGGKQTQKQQPLRAVTEEAGASSSEDEHADRFKRELQRAQGAAAQQGRQRAQRGRRNARMDAAAAAPAATQGAGQKPTAWNGGDGPRIESAAATVPHPASGVARCGSLPYSSDSAPVLQTIATLSSMGLIKRAPAEDMLEAPRLVIGAINEHLATALAKDCGLHLANYLMYA